MHASDVLRNGHATFNDDEVARRAALSPGEALAEYESACAAAQERLGAIADDVLRRAGILTWYGEACDLEDFVVHAFYGHSAQVMAQRDRLGIAVG